ncbi:MAG: sulfotransferase [Wenzhouxiangellaceae bacterium]|nr:sulfotransferase [Wenzhouxiangellaceae bacterium]
MKLPLTEPTTAHDRHVPAALFWKARFFDASARAWRRLGQLESAALRAEIDNVEITRPIYVAGVARSGTTIITEMLARHPDVTSHRYSDFPNVYTPYWRNWLAARSPSSPAPAVERAHRDRLMVTRESPEAVEEVIWMQFFEHLHDPARDQVMTGEHARPAFEAFYRDHIRKLLLARAATRYLSKGNYNATRLGYLLGLFPDARFVVPVRHPLSHVASLVKQDRLFCRLAAEDPRVPRQLRMSGHFEFGPGKACIHAGRADVAARIQALWANGRDVHGWALYWNAVYGHLIRAVESNPALREAVSFVRYEDLCRNADSTISGLLQHCRLAAEAFEPVRLEYLERLSEPDYYRPDFSEDEISQLLESTDTTAAWFGYSPDRAPDRKVPL